MLQVWKSVQEPALLLVSTIAMSATAIWMVTGLVVLAWRRASASTRHRLWSVSMLAVLIAPVAIFVLPIPRWVPRGHLPMVGSYPSVVTADQPHGSADTMGSIGHMVPAGPMGQPDSASPISPIGPVAPATEKDEPSVPNNPPAEPTSRAAVAGNRPASAPANAALVLPSLDELLSIVVWVWIFGALSSAVLLANSFRSVQIWLRAAIPVESGNETARCKLLCRRFSIDRPIRIVTSPETMVPFVSGFWRPVVVLPTGFGLWPADRLDVVLAHELIHVRRADVLWHVIGRLCLIPAWFHPLGWIAIWRLRVECEHACDDAVLLSGEAPSDYANHLIEIAAVVRQRSLALPSHVVAMARHSPVERRIRSILDPSVPRQPISRGGTWCACLVMATAILIIGAFSPKRSESNPPPETSVKQDVTETTKNAVEQPDASRDDRANSAVTDATKRIAALLDASSTIKVAQGAPLTDLLKSLVKQHRVPVAVDEWSFAARDATAPRFERISAVKVGGATVRDLLNSAMASALRPHNISLDLHELHGALEIRATGGSIHPQYAPDEFNCNNDKPVVTRIEGAVQDGGGRPVRNALIEIRNGYQLTFAIADEAGRFSIDIEYDRTFILRVCATDEATGNIAAWWYQRTTGKPIQAVTPVSLTVKPPRVLTFEVVDGNDNVVPQAHVGVSFGDFPIREILEGHTDDHGRARFSLAEDICVNNLFAAASGKGFDFVSCGECLNSASGRELPPQPEGAVRLKLTGALTVTLHVRDDENRPVAGVQFHPWSLEKPSENGRRGRTTEINLSLLSDAIGRVTTNQDGIAVFDWLPTWHSSPNPITFWHDSPDYVDRRFMYDPKKSIGGRIDVTLERPVTVTGRVVDANGQPSAGAKVTALGADYSYDRFEISTKTAEDGSYAMKVAPRFVYLFICKSSDTSQAVSRDKIVVSPNKPLTDFDLHLQPAARLFGRVTVGQAGAPVKGEYIHIEQYGSFVDQPNDSLFPKPPKDGMRHRPETFLYGWTDKDGRFEFRVSPGLFGIRSIGEKYVKTTEFEITHEKNFEIDFHSDGHAFRMSVVGDPATPKTAVHQPQSPVERFRRAVDDAGFSRKHVLISFHATSPWLIERAELELRKNFGTVEILSADGERAGAVELAKLLGIELPVDSNQYLLVVADEHGTMLGKLEPKDLTGDSLQSALIPFLRQHWPAKTDAKRVLAQARERARRENKRLLVQPMGNLDWETWTAPSRFLDRQRALWEQTYVWVVLDESWTNFELAIRPIRKASRGKLPEIAILEADGTVRAVWNKQDLDTSVLPPLKEAASAAEAQQWIAETLKRNLQRLIDKDQAREIKGPE